MKATCNYCHKKRLLGKCKWDELLHCHECCADMADTDYKWVVKIKKVKK